jgi:hypothetical protein
MILSAEAVLEIVRERGLEVRIQPGPPPMPVLHRPSHVPKSLVTPALMDALRVWRLEIIDILTHESERAGANPMQPAATVQRRGGPGSGSRAATVSPTQTATNRVARK